MFARHPVNDFATWYKTYKDFAAFQDANGVTARAVYQSAEDPNDVTVVHDFASVEAARAFAGHPELKEAMQKAGVAGPPTIWITTEA